MKKWYDEEYEWEIEVIGFLRSDHTERYCRNGEEIGDKYTCTYGCPVNQDGQGICSKVMTVMFPIMDVNNRVIGFGGRVLGECEPKYLNSPETLLFDKSRNLYGLNVARTSRKHNMLICEGYMDVIALHQAGFTNAVASLGTAFTGL